MSHSFQVALVSILFLVLGIGIRYKIGKRRFNRRNMMGIEIFSSYEGKTLTRAIEGLGMLISIFFILAGLAGVLVSLVKH